jgi:hypothetical protein
VWWPGGLTPIILFHGATAPSWQGSSDYQVFTVTLRYATLGNTPLDECSAHRRDLYLTRGKNIIRHESIWICSEAHPASYSVTYRSRRYFHGRKNSNSSHPHPMPMLGMNGATHPLPMFLPAVYMHLPFLTSTCLVPKYSSITKGTDIIIALKLHFFQDKIGFYPSHLSPFLMFYISYLGQ